MDAVHQILIVAHAIGDHVLSELWIAVILGHLHPLAEVVQFGIRHRWLLWQSGTAGRSFFSLISGTGHRRGEGVFAFHSGTWDSFSVIPLCY